MISSNVMDEQKDQCYKILLISQKRYEKSTKNRSKLYKQEFRKSDKIQA